ncbi:MAG: hypothetical protein RIS35_2457 [Pseudomonadota bacterium]
MSNELSPMSIATTGDARRMILETIADIRAGKMDAQTGLSIAANMKVLNDSIFAEVAVAKMQVQAKTAGHNFGQVSEMGRRLIAQQVEK